MGIVISDELFHFVGAKHPLDDAANFDTLTKVLDSGCVTYDPNVRGWGLQTFTINWGKSLVGDALVVPNMTCFCDIPYAHLRHTHIPKYGRFGLSLRKDHLIRHGARPVTYIPLHDDDIWGLSGRGLVKEFELIFEGFNEHLEEKLCPDEVDRGRQIGQPLKDTVETVSALSTLLMRDVFAFIKVYDATLPVTDPRYYYAEREWRRFGATPFAPEHVVTVVVSPEYLAEARVRWPKLRVEPTPA